MKTCHILVAGSALCGRFGTKPPAEWPGHHGWISREDWPKLGETVERNRMESEGARLCLVCDQLRGKSELQRFEKQAARQRDIHLQALGDQLGYYCRKAAADHTERLEHILAQLVGAGIPLTDLVYRTEALRPLADQDETLVCLKSGKRRVLLVERKLSGLEWRTTYTLYPDGQPSDMPELSFTREDSDA